MRDDGHVKWLIKASSSFDELICLGGAWKPPVATLQIGIACALAISLQGKATIPKANTIAEAAKLMLQMQIE